jgi:hypothetical protein
MISRLSGSYGLETAIPREPLRGPQELSFRDDRSHPAATTVAASMSSRKYDV